MWLPGMQQEGDHRGWRLAGEAKSIDSRRWQGPFFIVWTGQAFSLVGSALVRFALIWWLTEETGSATTLATASLASMLPFIVLGPFAGTLVDRWNRRWVMIVSDTLTALFTALMAYLYWLGVAQVWHVYAILFLRSLGEVFQNPAMRATTSLMAPKEQLTRVNGMNEMLQGLVNVASPPLGALLLEIMSMQGTLAIDFVTALLAIVPLAFVAVPQPESTASPQATTLTGQLQSVVRDTGTGFRYMWGWRGLSFLLVVLALVRFFIAPAFSLLPLLVTQHFGGDVLQLAWLNSAQGFGLVAGGIILSLWGGFRRRTLTALVGLFGVGLGTLAFGFLPATAFGLALVVMFFRMTMLPILRGSIISIFQAHVPPDMQGRLFTQLMSVITIAVPLGLAIGGPLADAFGVQLLFIIAGAGCLLLVLVWVLSPAVLYLEDYSDENEYNDQQTRRRQHGHRSGDSQRRDSVEAGQVSLERGGKD
jgi:DHA3 family macrolide efflux protein-like MFS transporter